MVRIKVAASQVICRIGSLEMALKVAADKLIGYLPHRQFRKTGRVQADYCKSYLPHRQFRNFYRHQ